MYLRVCEDSLFQSKTNSQNRCENNDQPENLSVILVLLPDRGKGDVEIGEFLFDALFVNAVAGVAGFLFWRSVFLITEMVGHLGLHGFLSQFLAQLFQNPGFPDAVFRIRIILHQGIERVIG